MGGIAMTRRSIATALGSLLVALLITVNISTVSADSTPILSKSVCTHPALGFPTCYTQQADGTWAREELPDIDANWVVVGTVTADEVAAAIGDANATAVHVASFGSAATAPGIGSADYDTILESMEKVVGITAPVVTTSAPYMEAFTPLPGQDR
jgi:hypothetical protein